MNRPIKLKAWDKEQGAFVPLLSLSQLDSPHPALTIIQFTGVLDYFGREIWEGDIIRWTHYDDQENSYNEYHYEVAFRHGCFGTLEPLMDGEQELTPYERSESDDVVVGNVFENAHLLTQNLCLQW